MIASGHSTGDINPDALFAKAWSLHARGKTEILKDADFEKVSGTFQEALVASEMLTKDFPRLVLYKLRLSRILLDQGSYLIAKAKPAEGSAALERARQILDELLNDSPGHPIESGVLGRVLGEIGRLELNNGEMAKARDHIEQAVKLQAVALKANPKSPDDLLAMTQHKEALKALTPIEGKQP